MFEDSNQNAENGRNCQNNGQNILPFIPHNRNSSQNNVGENNGENPPNVQLEEMINKTATSS